MKRLLFALILLLSGILSRAQDYTVENLVFFQGGKMYKLRLYSDRVVINDTTYYSFPGFGTSHSTAAYGDHGHTDLAKKDSLLWQHTASGRTILRYPTDTVYAFQSVINSIFPNAGDEFSVRFPDQGMSSYRELRLNGYGYWLSDYVDATHYCDVTSFYSVLTGGSNHYMGPAIRLKNGDSSLVYHFDAGGLWFESTYRPVIGTSATRFNGWCHDILADGKIGVGTNSPSYPIDVVGTTVYGGIHSLVTTGWAISGEATSGKAVVGSSTTGYGVHGYATGSGYGLYGESMTGTGIYGHSVTGYAGRFVGKTLIDTLLLAKAILGTSDSILVKEGNLIKYRLLSALGLLTSSDILNSTGTNTTKAISQGAVKNEIDSTVSAIRIWTGITGTRVSTSSFSFPGTQEQAYAVNKSLFKCISANGDSIHVGYIKSVAYSGGTITCTVISRSRLYTGAKSFKIAVAEKVYGLEGNYRWTNYVPTTIQGDATNPAGKWYPNTPDTMYVISTQPDVLTAASGGTPDATYNLFDNSTAIYNVAVSMGTNTTLADQVPATPYKISPGHNVYFKWTTSTGTTRAADATIKVTWVPASIVNAP